MPQNGEAKLLSSWKEIAAYLGKSVRTVQRWERDFGLPVRRPNHGSAFIVFAEPNDLQSWTREQGCRCAAARELELQQLRERCATLEAEVARLRERCESLEQRPRPLRRAG